MNRVKRAKGRARMKRAYERRKADGFVHQTIWMSTKMRESLSVRAKQLGMSKSVVMTAALYAGLRTVTTSEIIRVDQQWHEKVKKLSEVRYTTNDPRRYPVENLRRRKHASQNQETETFHGSGIASNA